MQLSKFLDYHGMSQAEFGKLIGASQPSISRYIAGSRMPRPMQLIRIRKVTRGAVTADDFIFYAIHARKTVRR